MPWFVELQDRYAGEGLQVVGVAVDDASPDDIEKFASELGVNYPILVGEETVGNAYGGVQFLPSTFYIGRDGKVVGKVFGLKRVRFLGKLLWRESLFRFRVECEHVGPRVMPGHIEGQEFLVNLTQIEISDD
jgi:AhpC/TSA family